MLFRREKEDINIPLEIKKKQENRKNVKIRTKSLKTLEEI